MPITVEQQRTEQFADGEREISFVARGTDDAVEARDAVLALAPASLPIDAEGTTLIYPQSPRMIRAAAELWTGSVRYTYALGTLPMNQSELSFRVGGGSQHISYSVDHWTYPAAWISPDADWGGGIAVDRKTGEPRGIDIPAPTFTTFREQVFYASELTTTYIRNIGNLVGKYNQSVFDGWAPREALLLSVNGKREPDRTKYRIGFEFGICLTRTGVNIGGVTIGTVQGWDFIDPVVEQQVDKTSGKVLSSYVAGVIVHQLFEEADFDVLGLNCT